MIKSHFLLAAPAVFALAAVACSAEISPSESTSASSEAVTGCSALYGQCGGNGWSGATCCASGSTCTYSNAWYSQCLPGSGSGGSGSGGGTQESCPSGAHDDQQRSAATAAFGIMKAAAAACGGASAGPCWGTTILASQRYRVASGGQSIEFDPTDPQYNYVPQGAKVALAIAELDPTVASFLVSGLQWGQQNTNGQLFPLIEPLAALANFSYPGNSKPIVIQDPAAGNNRRSDVVTGTAWCGTERVHFADTSWLESSFATFGTIGYSNFYGATKPAYKGANSWPSTPFNGTGGAANPYLVVSVNGTNLNWNSSTWPTQDCSKAGTTCSGTIDIDPIPYTQPGEFYDVNNNLVGPQVNPFTLNITNQYADASRQGQWATRTVSGNQQWGTFSNPINVLGTTIYQYVRQM